MKPLRIFSICNLNSCQILRLSWKQMTVFKKFVFLSFLFTELVRSDSAKLSYPYMQYFFSEMKNLREKQL